MKGGSRGVWREGVGVCEGREQGCVEGGSRGVWREGVGVCGGRE